MPPALSYRAPRLWPLYALWLAFVVYGSLVPLDFHPLPLDQAWQKLLHAPMFKVGMQGRADWVANGVLYLPVGFLGTAVLLGPEPAGALRRLWLAAVSVLVGISLALTVELAQTAFPPRTVSRNDLMAESLGTLLGSGLAWLGSTHFQALLVGLRQGGALLARRLGPWYAPIYLVLALFPYDLVLDVDEWQAKLDSGMVGWWLSDVARHGGRARLLAKLTTEALVMLPLGALWAQLHYTAGRPGHSAWRRAALLGAIFGLVVETAQLAFVSGQSQGASVLTRALGMALGALAWQHAGWRHPETLRAGLRRFSAPLLAALLPLLLVYQGAWRGPWLSLAQAGLRLQDELRFMPFYYHYYTTELLAVLSLVAVSLSYAPLGLLGWAWHAPAGLVAALAMLLATLMEASKLMAQTGHPDPSNIWIAGTACWLAQTGVRQLLLPAATGAAADRLPVSPPVRPPVLPPVLPPLPPPAPPPARPDMQQVQRTPTPPRT